MNRKAFIEACEYAIEHAKGYGNCTYVKDGEPQCVVAQFVARAVPQALVGLTEGYFINEITDGSALGLDADQLGVLRCMQARWDGFATADGAKQEMQDLLTSYAAPKSPA